MASHEYDSRQALDLLLRQVRKKEPELADDLQSAIDAGKEAEENRGPMVYRKTMPLNSEEALRVAIDVLRAHFVERPLFVTSAMREFGWAVLGSDEHRRKSPLFDEPELMEKVSSAKQLEVEIQTETQLSRVKEGTVALSAPDEELIEQQRMNVQKLDDLVKFGAL